MPYTIDATEWVDLDGIPLATPAWQTANPLELLQGARTRGQDRIIPGAAGVRPHRRRATVTARQLLMHLYGHVDWEGNPYADPRAGLEANILHLRANVTDALVAEPGTRTATLHLLGGVTKTGPVHVQSFDVEFVTKGYARATLELSIPGGALS